MCKVWFSKQTPLTKKGRGYVVQQQIPLAQVNTDGNNITVNLFVELLSTDLAKLFWSVLIWG